MKKTTFLAILLIAVGIIWSGCSSEDEPQGGNITVDGLSLNIEKLHQTNMGYDAQRNWDKIILIMKGASNTQGVVSDSCVLEVNFFVPFPNSVIVAGRYSTAAKTLSGTLKFDGVLYVLDSTATVRVTTTNGKTNYSLTLSGKTTTGKSIAITYDGSIPGSSLASVGIGEVSFSSDSARSPHKVLYAWQSSVKTLNNHCRQCLDMLVQDNIKVAITITHTDDAWISTLQSGTTTIGQTASEVTTCQVYYDGAWKSLKSGDMQLTKDADNYTVSMSNGVFADTTEFSFNYNGTLVLGTEWEVNKE